MEKQNYITLREGHKVQYFAKPHCDKTTLIDTFISELTLTIGDSSEEVEEPGLVIVVDSSDGGSLDFGGLGGFGGFGRFPGFNPQQFSGFGEFPSRLPSSFGFEEDSTPEISIDLSDIFGRQPSGDEVRVPGIINQLFDALGGHLGVQIDGDGGEGSVTLHGSEGGPVGDGEYDHHNSTFDEKVLPDGSVVRVNRTIIKDTDENGNSFFFSSSVHHVLQEGEDDNEQGSAEEESEVPSMTEDEAELVPTDIDETKVENNDEKEESDIPAVTDVEEDFGAAQYDEEAELVPTDIDEAKEKEDNGNEAVPDNVDESENEIQREAKSEFDGTDATASVEDIF